SALDTTFCATTRMSPSRSSAQDAISPARSSPGRTSGSPVTPLTRSEAAVTGPASPDGPKLLQVAGLVQVERQAGGVEELEADLALGRVPCELLQRGVAEVQVDHRRRAHVEGVGAAPTTGRRRQHGGAAQPAAGLYHPGQVAGGDQRQVAGEQDHPAWAPGRRVLEAQPGGRVLARR